MDNLDLQTALEIYEKASDTYKNRIEGEGKSLNKLREKEEKIHEEHFKKVLVDDWSVGKYEKLLKYDSRVEALELKSWAKRKELAKQDMRDAEHRLNVIKIQIRT